MNDVANRSTLSISIRQLYSYRYLASRVSERIYSRLNSNSLAKFLDSSRRRLATVRVYTYVYIYIYYVYVCKYLLSCKRTSSELGVKLFSTSSQKSIFTRFLSEHNNMSRMSSVTRARLASVTVTRFAASIKTLKCTAPGHDFHPDSQCQTMCLRLIVKPREWPLGFRFGYVTCAVNAFCIYTKTFTFLLPNVFMHTKTLEWFSKSYYLCLKIRKLKRNVLEYNIAYT